MPLTWGLGQYPSLQRLFGVFPPDEILYGRRLLTFLSLCLTGNAFRLPPINVSHLTDAENIDPCPSVAAVSAAIGCGEATCLALFAQKTADFPSHCRRRHPDDRILETSGTRHIAIYRLGRNGTGNEADPSTSAE